ncbi:MAG: hypothetical protein Q8Q57_08910 [Methylotenera sp.]|nr:hypothetical protein [Methylotenera sp.]
MTPNEMGQVFSILMKHREILGNPIDRNLRDSELEAAQILSRSSSIELEDFEEFLNSQGLSLYIRDAFEIGIPPKHGRPNFINVLIRKRNEELSSYISQGWFLEQMKDGRGNVTKTERAIWTTRLWFTLQWFFYQRIDRLPHDVSMYRDALFTEKLLLETLSQGIERLGNEGRPDGEKGLVWDVIWNGKKNLEGYVSRFIKVMLAAGMIEEAGNPFEYRQTLLAAVEMSIIAENELTYLMPPETELKVDTRTVEMLIGEALKSENKDTQDANYPAN